MAALISYFVYANSLPSLLVRGRTADCLSTCSKTMAGESSNGKPGGRKDTSENDPGRKLASPPSHSQSWRRRTNELILDQGRKTGSVCLLSLSFSHYSLLFATRVTRSLVSLSFVLQFFVLSYCGHLTLYLSAIHGLLIVFNRPSYCQFERGDERHYAFSLCSHSFIFSASPHLFPAQCLSFEPRIPYFISDLISYPPRSRVQPCCKTSRMPFSP